MSPNFQKHVFNLNRTLVLSIQLSCYIKTSYIFLKFQEKAQWVRYEQKMIILQLKIAKLVDCIIEKTSNVFVIVTFQIFEKTSDEGFISSNEYFLSTFLIILFLLFSLCENCSKNTLKIFKFPWKSSNKLFIWIIYSFCWQYTYYWGGFERNIDHKPLFFLEKRVNETDCVITNVWFMNIDFWLLFYTFCYFS